MLGTPDRLFALLLDLHGQHTLDALRQRGFGWYPLDVAEHRISRFAIRDGLEQFQNVRHGIVIERDVIVITAFQRINLRPAAVGELRGADEMQSLDDCRPTILAFRRQPNAREQTDLFRGRAVVECCDVVRRLTWLILGSPLHAGRARAFGETDVLGPTT